MILKFKNIKKARSYKKFVEKTQKQLGLKCHPKVNRSYEYVKGKKEPIYYVRERCK